jgi:hypothetical protein
MYKRRLFFGSNYFFWRIISSRIVWPQSSLIGDSVDESIVNNFTWLLKTTWAKEVFPQFTKYMLIILPVLLESFWVEAHGP